MQLQNLRLLVCWRCEDEYQEQLRAKILSADPLPIYNARPEPFTYTGFSYQESNIMVQPSFSTEQAYDDNLWDNNVAILGLAGDGPQMLMPDGETVLLMPSSGNQRYPTGDFNVDENDDYLKLQQGF